MTAAPVLTTEFVGSFPDPLTRLDPPLAELAFLGRSNVGKSSLLNALVGRKDLARVSATPGKTQTMNVFRVGGRKSQISPGALRPATLDPRPYYLIDLPGYGYAKVNKGERQRFRSLVERYVGERPTVTAVAWLLDARREPSDDDGKMLDLLVKAERPVLAILTKGDKLGREEQRSQQRLIGRTLGLEDDQMTMTSSRTGVGIAEVRESIAALLEQRGDA